MRPTPSTSRSRDRKSTRLNSSHVETSYAVFCLKKKNHIREPVGGLIAAEVIDGDPAHLGRVTARAELAAQGLRGIVDDHVVVADVFFFFNDTATTEIYTLSLYDALPISGPAPEIAAKWCPKRTHLFVGT